MKLETDSQKIEEVLRRGVEQILPSKEGLKRLMKKRRIKLYCGYDPSASSLHLGHLITLRKLAQFQALGHEVIMLIGDFTGMIGDPTGKTITRRKMSREEVLKNSQNYKKQAIKFLKFSGSNPAKILYNSQWLDKLNFNDLIEISSNFTVQQMIVRDMFQERIKKKGPIFLHEFLYPLAQGYDSVALDVDLEVGGKDQLFNMLCGRKLMKTIKNKEKFVLATKLLTDPSGKKMGKSEGNVINLNFKPDQIYGSIMAWPDEMISLGFELCTDFKSEEIEEISKGIKEKKINPREVKSKLAKEIVTLCYSRKEAEEAAREFDKVFRKKELPSEIPTVRVEEKTLDILDLLVKTKLASSKSEAKRLIFQKGVKIDGFLEKDWRKRVQIKKGMIIQVGKRRFIKLN